MRINRLFFLVQFLLLVIFCKAQVPVIVTEQTIELKKVEELYYAFADGDKIKFNFEEVDGEGIQEVIISQYPNDVKFSDFKTSKISDKVLDVVGKSIYKFEFKNRKKAICRIKIERIPNDESTQSFNTAVKWVEKMDTTFNVQTKNVVVGYEDYQVTQNRRVLDRIDTSITEVMSRTERVHSTTNLNNSNKNQFHFTLPANIYNPSQILPMVSEETVAWAYSITVGDNGDKWYQDANKRAMANTGINSFVTAGIVSTGVGALAGLALNGYSAFSNPPEGDNIKFSIVTNNSLISSGNSVAAAGRVTNSNQGHHYVRLENDNLMNGVNVTINIIAVRVKKVWRNEPYTVTKQRKVKEKKVVKTPKKVELRKVPVFIE